MLIQSQQGYKKWGRKARLPLEFQCLEVVLHVLCKEMADLLLEKIPFLRCRVSCCVEKDLGFISSVVEDCKLRG